MNLDQPCTTCAGTGKEPSSALRAALDAASEHRKAIGCGSLIRPDNLTEIVKVAITEFIRVSAEEVRESEPIPPPTVRLVWRTRADAVPGPEVKAVRDSEEDIWIRDPENPSYWECGSLYWPWADIIDEFSPLEDWTHEIA